MKDPIEAKRTEVNKVRHQPPNLKRGKTEEAAIERCLRHHCSEEKREGDQNDAALCLPWQLANRENDIWTNEVSNDEQSKQRFKPAAGREVEFTPLPP